MKHILLSFWLLSFVRANSYAQDSDLKNNNMVGWKLFHSEGDFPVQDYYIHAGNILMVNYDHTKVKIVNFSNPEVKNVLIDLRQEKSFLTGYLSNSDFNFSSYKGEPAFFPLISSGKNLDYLIASIGRQEDYYDSKIIVYEIPMDINFKRLFYMPELFFFGTNKNDLVTVHREFGENRENYQDILSLRDKNLNIVEKRYIQKDFFPLQIKNRLLFFDRKTNTLFDIDSDPVFSIPEEFSSYEIEKVFYDKFNREVIFAFKTPLNYKFLKVDVSEDLFDREAVAYNKYLPTLIEKGKGYALLNNKEGKIYVFESFNWGEEKTRERFVVPSKQKVISSVTNSSN